MKKKLALLLAAAMCLQPLAAISTSAGDESAVDKVYADVYGIEIDFATAEDATAAVVSLEEKDSGTDVALTPQISSTKLVLTPDNGALLDVDTPYTLTIDGEEKDFQIKTMFFEDFEDLTYTAPTLTPEQIAAGAVAPLPGEDIAVDTTKTVTNNYGTYSIIAGEDGAFVRVVNGDTEVGVTKGAFAITGIDTYENLADATLMADIKGYRRNRSATAMTIANYPRFSMLSRSQTTEGTDYTKAAKALFKRSGFEIGTTAADGAYTTATENAAYVNHADGYYEFGLLVNTGSTVVSKDTAVDGTNESNERAVALRTNGKTITGFADAEPVTYTNEAVETTAGDFVIGLTTANIQRTLTVIDNVRVTMYTEDLSAAPSGTISEPTLDGDTTKLTLDFNEELTGVGPISLDTIEVYADDVAVDAVITPDADDKSVINIVPDGLSADITYTVVVPQGFGVGNLRVEETGGFSLTKYIAPDPMSITNKAITPTGIVITFDKEISTMSTTEDGYVKVYTKALGADDSTYTEIAYANITFTKEGNMLKIAPNTFEVDNTYKVVVAQGYGDTNTKITAQTADTYIVDFVKIELIPTAVTGNLGVVMVEFNNEIDTSMSTSGIKIYNAQTGAEQTTTATISNGILKINFPTMEKNVDYEVFIPENFGTNVLGTKKDFRKKFVQKVIASEDFEGTTIGATIPGIKSASVAVDRWNEGSTNHRGYITSAAVLTTASTYNADGTLNTLGTEDMENLTIEFKVQGLFPIRDNTSSDAKKYGESMMYDQLHFNIEDNKNYQYLYFCGSNYQLRDQINGTASTKKTGTKPYQEKCGDAYQKSDGSFFVYKVGEAFNIADAAYAYTGKVLNTSGAAVEACATAPHDGSITRMIKTGNTVSIWVDKDGVGTETGFQQAIEPQTMTNSEKTGVIKYYPQNTTYRSLDDIEISTLMVYEETGLVVASSTLTPTGGDWSTATETTGSVTLANYTNADVETAVIAVAYGANGKMLGAYYNDSVSAVAAGGREYVPFTISGLNAGETESVKVFVWNNTTNRAPMDVVELMSTN